MSADAGQQSFTRRSSLLSYNQIFRKYYQENDIFSSPEGILKLLSILACVVLCALFLREQPCSGVAGAALVWSSASLAAAAAAAEAALAAGRALLVPLLAPQPWLYTDIIVSTVSGVLLLVTGVLNLTLCELGSALDYLHGPLAIVIASMLVASAALTYFSAMRLWDAAAGPTVESRAPPSRDLEV